jgi:hypothetical protein
MGPRLTTPAIFRPIEILRVLSDAQVEFIIVGGLAAIAHGWSQSTRDFDAVAPESGSCAPYGTSRGTTHDCDQHLEAPASACTPHRAAVAGQALANGVSQVVAVTLGEDLDDHFAWAGQQPASLRTGFDALGRLIASLKTKPAPGTTKTMWQCTNLMVFSEFSRTPMINAGRPRHVAQVDGPVLRPPVEPEPRAARRVDPLTRQSSMARGVSLTFTPGTERPLKTSVKIVSYIVSMPERRQL